jgi:phosphate transport system ATP-binding protein
MSTGIQQGWAVIQRFNHVKRFNNNPLKNRLQVSQPFLIVRAYITTVMVRFNEDKRDIAYVATDKGSFPSTPNKTIVKLKDLHVGFGEQEILHGISADFSAQRITTILGPTGCGKTTLLRTLNRLNELVSNFHLEGRVELDGLDIYKDMRDVRNLYRRVGMLFQRPNPFPQSIEENIAIGLRAHNIVKRQEIHMEVEQKLREVGLWEAVKDKLDQSPFGLSGGEQQLLCLARTLAVRPEVILLDEPTSSLDPISTQRVEDLLTALKQRVTIIMVTHNMQQAARVSDDVIFLYEGEVVETNTVKELFLNPKNRITEDYITGRMG